MGGLMIFPIRCIPKITNYIDEVNYIVGKYFVG